MSRKHKNRGGFQPMRAVRSIRELGTPTGDGDYEINDGEEFQARDGSSVLTFAEAEAEERREVRERRAAMRMAKPAVARLERTIPELVWRIVKAPGELLVDLFKIAFTSRKEGRVR